MSKQRAKGTRREVGWLPGLRRIWPNVKRAGNTLGPNDEGDYYNTGDWFVDSKHAKSLLIQQWVRDLDAKAEGGHPWMLLCRADKRKFPYDLAIMPFEQAVTLLEAVKEKLQ